MIHHSPGWQISDRQMFKDYVTKSLGSRLLKDIRPVDIQRILREVHLQGRSASTTNRVRQLMNKMFNEAVETHRYISFNPVRSVRKLKENPKVTPHLSRDHATKLLEWARKHPLGVALQLGLQLGLREGEIVGLKWDAINLSRRELIVQRKWEKKSKRLEEFPKGKKIRVLGIYPDGLLEALNGQRTRFPNAEFVVSDSNGQRVEPHQLIHVLAQGVIDTGIRRISMHGLRHTFASLYMQSGGSLYDLQKLMGHTSIGTTERYRHTDPEYMKERCNVFDLYRSSAQIPPKIATGGLRVIEGGVVSGEDHGGEGEIRTLETR